MNVRNMKYQIPNSIFAENRKKIVSRMNALGHKSGQVFLQGGNLKPFYDTDLEYAYHQESFFYYLFGYEEDGAYGSIDLATGKSILFIQKMPASFAVWVGYLKEPEFYAKKYGIDECHFSTEIPTLLKGKTLFVLDGKNTDSGLKLPMVSFPKFEEEFQKKDLVNTSVLYNELVECRVFKTEEEMKVFRHVVQIGVKAHNEMMKKCHPGIYEFEMESNYMHCMQMEGARYWGFSPIIAGGNRSATLHYFRNNIQLNDGELVCCDMGADYSGFKSDITTTYPVNGKYTPDQKFIYETVLKANRAVIAAVKDGVEWNDMHMLSYRVILERLIEFGILKGDVEEMLKADLGYCFMPHGLGHLMGLGVHDVGGHENGISRKPKIKANLRCTRPVKSGMVITVEPGCYFNPVLIQEYMEKEETKKFFTEKVKDFYDFGGVRIEDDILITKDGCEILSVGIPRTVEEIEKFMKKE